MVNNDKHHRNQTFESDQLGIFFLSWAYIRKKTDYNCNDTHKKHGQLAWRNNGKEKKNTIRKILKFFLKQFSCYHTQY